MPPLTFSMTRKHQHSLLVIMRVLESEILALSFEVKASVSQDVQCFLTSANLFFQAIVFCEMDYGNQGQKRREGLHLLFHSMSCLWRCGLHLIYVSLCAAARYAFSLLAISAGMWVAIIGGSAYASCGLGVIGAYERASRNCRDLNDAWHYMKWHGKVITQLNARFCLV